MQLREPARKPETSLLLIAERQDLAERYLPLAKALAKPFKQSRPDDADDIDGEACLALVQAADEYVPGGFKFPTYAIYKIKQSLIDYCRKRDRQKRFSSVNIDELPLPDETSFEALSELESEEFFAMLKEDFDEFAFEVLRRVHFQDESVRSVASSLGVDRKRVTQVLNSASQLLADRLAEAS